MISKDINRNPVFFPTVFQLGKHIGDSKTKHQLFLDLNVSKSIKIK